MEKHTIIDGSIGYITGRYPEENEITIVDLTNAKCCDKSLIQNEEKIHFYGHEPYFKYSKEQVQRIVELVYLKHQVEQYNKVVSGQQVVHCPRLHKDRKPVTLEEIKPHAFEVVSELYDSYSTIPKGNYYLFSHKLDEKVLTWNYVKDKLPPHTIVSGKRFDGFVTRSVEFWYAPLGNSTFDFDDRTLGIPWPLTDIRLLVNHQINIELSSHFDESFESADESQLKQLICNNYCKWKKLYSKLKTDKWKEEIEKNKKHRDSVPEWSECNTWDEYLQYCIDRDKPNPNFQILAGKKTEYKLGFVPNTCVVSNPREIFDFAKRWLNSEEEGEHFETEFQRCRIWEKRNNT